MKIKKKVKIGILGCADVAERYAIKAFQSIDNCEIVSIASRDYKKAKKWALNFGIQAEKSYDSLLKNNNIDAVYIPLPIGLHKKWAIKAATAGKHIICEKSLADNFKSVKSVVDTCRARGVILYENFMCDFHPQHEKVLTLIKRRDIGRPFVFKGYFGFPPFDKNNIRYDRKLGGSSLTDAGAHIVFMARKIFGQEPISVSCSLINNKKIGIDLQGTAMLKFPDEQVALLAFGYCSAYQNNYSVWGSEAVINVKRAYSIGPEMKPIIEIVKTENYKEESTTVDAPKANQFEIIFHDFCDTILNKEIRAKKINNKYSQIIAQAKVLEAMRRSSQEKKIVRIEEIR